jgi:hypothetical protein
MRAGGAQMAKGFAEHWLADKTKREARSRARRTFWTAASAVGSVVASGPVIWGAVFSGEVEALNTPTIRRLTPSRHHQLPRITQWQISSTTSNAYLPAQDRRRMTG